MIEIKLTVNKVSVYDEVAKTTSYTGAKMQDDEKAYDRIFTTDDDRMMLERFWNEASNAATEQFKPFLISVSGHSDGRAVDLEKNYEVELGLSNSFDAALKDSIETSLWSFFVSYITSRWFKIANKKEAGEYGNDADGMLDDVMRKIYYKKKPQRVKPNSNH